MDRATDNLSTASSSSDTNPDTPRACSPSSSSSFSSSSSSASSAVHRALHLIQSDDPDLKLEAAREIRRLTKTSQRCRRQLAQAVQPLVLMLRAPDSDHESALLALLNLAVKDEKYFLYFSFSLSLNFFKINLRGLSCKKLQYNRIGESYY